MKKFFTINSNESTKLICQLFLLLAVLALSTESLWALHWTDGATCQYNSVEAETAHHAPMGMMMAPPVNDDCGGAIALTVNPDLACGTVTPGTIAEATASPEDPSACFGTEDDDVWFTFVATATSHQIELLNIANGTTDLYHSVWEGTCGSLTLVPGTCSDPNSSTPSGLTPGNTYHLRVYSWTSTPGQTSTFDVCIGTLPPIPTNDDCANALPINVENNGDCPANATTGSTVSSTDDGFLSCDATGINNGVWYSFVAPAAGSVNLQINEVSGNHEAAIFDACGGTEVFCDNTPNNELVSGLTPGNTYFLIIWSDAGSEGTHEVCLQGPPPAPANDDCANAVGLTVGSAGSCPANATTGTTSGATDDGAFGCDSTTPNSGVWYSFVPTSSVVNLQINEVSGNHKAAIFDACGGTEVFCDITPNDETVTGLTAGNTYFLVIWSDAFSTSGTHEVCIQGTCPDPSALNVTNITGTTADLTWTPGGGCTAGAEYWVEITGSPAPTVGTGTGVGCSPAFPITATGLSSGSTYDVWVYEDCGTGGTAGPVNLGSFFVAGVLTPPICENFDGFPTCGTSCSTVCPLTGGWVNSGADDADWLVDAGGTTSSGTGPLDDVTGGGNYLYTEATSCSNNVAILTSPTYDISGLGTPALNFYYHMFGGDMGTLTVEVEDPAGSGTYTQIFSLTGQQQAAQADPFIQAIIPLTVTGPNISFRFTGTIGPDFESDMAIDEICVQEAPACSDPLNLTANATSATTATLAWDAVPGAASYNWEVVPQGNAQGVGVVQGGNTASTSVDVTGLTAQTSYSFYVQADCGGGALSNYAGPTNFTTPCVTFTAPFTEDFENGGAIPACWAQGASNSENWLFGTAGGHVGNAGAIGGSTNSGGNFAWVDDSSPHSTGTTLESPFIDASGLASPQLSFFLISNNEGNTNVDFSVDVWDGAMWNVGVFTSNSNTLNGEWEQIFVDLSTLTITGPIQLRFIVDENNGTDFYDDVAIDDVTVGEPLICLNPSALAASNFTPSSADITWTPGGGCSASGEYWVQTSGTPAPTMGSGTTVACPPSFPIAVSSLMPNTTYHVWVYEDCGANGTAGPVNIGSFTTPSGGTVTCGTPLNQTYCYDNNDTQTFVYTASDGTSPLTLTFNAGGIESCCDAITIYDGSDNTGTVLFTGANGGDLTGVTVASTGPNLFMEIDSDNSVSCDDGGTCCATQWDWDVVCFVAPTCNMVSLVVSNASACNDNGTSDPSDDFFTADVTIAFTDPPATGTLDLAGSGSASVSVGSLDGPTSHTFTSVMLPADDPAAFLTATFSDDVACTISEDLITPGSCSCDLVINEVDYDQPGTDGAEFIEIYNPCSSAINLDGYSLELVNGSGGGAVVYENIVLPAMMLAAGDYFVVCANGSTVANCDMMGFSSVQNGAPDAVGLRKDATLVDAVSYEGDTGAPYTEGSGSGLVDTGTGETSISRIPNGTDTDMNNVDFTEECSTPGTENGICPTTFAIVAEDADKAEGNSGTTAFTFTVTRSGDVSGANDVDWAVTGSGGDPADANDFGGTLPSGTVMFAAGETMKTITVDVSGDLDIEASEQFTVTLSNPTNGATITTATADGRIQNDDGLSCPAVGDLVITEIMQNPLVVGDGSGEFFEVWNSTGSPINMDGMTIQDDGSDSHVISGSVIVPAGGFVVFGNNADFGTNGGVNVDYEYNGFNLANGDDEVVIVCQGVVLDAVDYDGGPTFPDPNGATMSLDPSSFNPTDNDDGANWCEGSTPFGSGDLGTPGAANPACPVAPAELAIAADDADKNEGDAGTTAFTFTVTRSVNTSGANDVDWAVTGSGGDPANAADFGGSLPSGTTQFAAGETMKTITVNVSGDSDVEADENFTVTLSNPTNGAIVTTSTAEGTIRNDDCTLQTWYADTDMDGFGDPDNTTMACDPPTGFVLNADDCDDNDGAINPNATEVCDGVDNNCDGNIDEGVLLTFYEDFDGDGFGNSEVTTMACSAPAGYVDNADDCDDTNGAVNPEADEICDGIDNDCDGTTDENPVTGPEWFADTDMDGFGDAENSVIACSQPAGFVANDSDCDDTDAAINPNAQEICNGIDDDCDGDIDEFAVDAPTWYADSDGDGFGDQSTVLVQCEQPEGYVDNLLDCDDTDAAINPNTIWYVDFDGDGFGNPASSVMTCDPGPGYVLDNTDCNDNIAAVNPDAVEICDGIDNNCDGNIDEGVQTTYYEDSDGDGFGNPAVSQMACSAPLGYVENADDCDDADGAVNPDATEVCDGVDNNCDGNIDEGVTTTFYADTDGDGFGDPANTIQACDLPAGYVTNANDCDDTDGNVNPNATEICGNAIDDNCDGQVDEGCDCSIVSISVENISDCDDNGTPDPFDDTFTADVTVTFSSMPQTGTLDLSGDASANVMVGNIVGNSHTFAGLTMDADAGAIMLTASFSDDPTCTLTNGNAGIAPGPCSGTCEVAILNVIAVPETCPGHGDGSITIEAIGSGQVGYSIDGGATFQFDELFTNLTPGTYDILVQVFGTPTCSATTTATVMPPAPGSLMTWYQDFDNDGYSPGNTVQACERPTGFKLASELTSTSGDCNDYDPAETVPQDWYLDADGDGHSDGTSVNQCERPANHYLASELTATSGDCNDNDASIYPGAPEICNGIDDDCDGEIDEGAAGGLTYVGNVYLPNQAAVEAFSQCYSIIQGNLTIQNSAVNDLTHLINLEMVTGNVYIKSTSLTTLDGLQNIHTIGGYLKVEFNNSLTTLYGLHSVTSVGGYLRVYRNQILTDCCAIYDLINNGGVGGSITISRNDTGCDNIGEINIACGGGSNSFGTPNGNAISSTSFEPVQSVNVYPNPLSDILTVNIAQDFEAGSLEIFDLQGRLVHSRKLGAGEVQFKLSLGNLNTGTYLLHMLLDGENFSERLMVE